jgi:hypothetical protein
MEECHFLGSFGASGFSVSHVEPCFQAAIGPNGTDRLGSIGANKLSAFSSRLSARQSRSADSHFSKNVGQRVGARAVRWSRYGDNTAGARQDAGGAEQGGTRVQGSVERRAGREGAQGGAQNAAWRTILRSLSAPRSPLSRRCCPEGPVPEQSNGRIAFP